MRIALASNKPAVEVGGEALAIFDGDDGESILRFERDRSVRVVAAGKEVRLLVDGKRTSARAQRIFVEAKDAVRVQKGVYFGRIEIVPDPKHRGRLLVINRIPLETYLLGIVGSEMSPSWPLEALKAQAVAARTYAMQRRAMMRAANRPYDLASTVISQVYKGAERIRPSVIEAVKQTRGVVMSHHHDLVEALFHSTCGGRTVPAEVAFGGRVPYLRAQDCSWCADSTRYRWDLALSLVQVSKRLEAAGLARGGVRALERPAGAAKVQIRDSRGNRKLDPRSLRRALGFGELFSERFSAHTRGRKVYFKGRGFGHGVGLCQWGARGQASKGRTYRQILTHYYPGIRLKRLY